MYFIIDSTNITELKKDVFSSKDLPLVPNYNDKIVSSLSTTEKNVNSSEFCEFLEPELQKLLENNFEGIEHFDDDITPDNNNAKEAVDSNQS